MFRFCVTFLLSSGLVGDFGRKCLSGAYSGGSFDSCRIGGVDCILLVFLVFVAGLVVHGFSAVSVFGIVF